MGLAASQARFLGLTARKSNTEYKAQQINQARTALSNEVMGLYNEYNRLEVPTPPSVADYQKTTYTLEETVEGYEITSFSKITEGPYEGFYNVTLSYDEDVPKAYPYTPHVSITAQEDETGSFSYLNYSINGKTYTYESNSPETSTITKITENYEKYPGLETIIRQVSGFNEGPYYMYVENGRAYYTTEADLKSTAFSESEGKKVYSGDYTFEYQGKQATPKTVTAIGSLTQEKSGRLSAIEIMQCPDDGDLVGNTYSITTGTEDDQAKYDDAMNQYYYEKELYEKEVERINIKTREIQQEDRSLELQLNQLDTEQRAISTEMDSVKEVLKSTIDSVFKTFDG